MTAGPAAVRYFEYDHSRSHLVAQRILGAKWRGWLVTDFYAAYNLIPGRHQRCWVHLLRDLHDLKQEQAANPEVVQWVTDVRKLYDDAHTWLAAHPTPTLAERRTEYADLFTQVCRLGEQYALTYDHPCCTLAKRVLRHQDELFQFVLVPGLPADNNLAERSIRPLVIMRKISGGSRSAEGTDNPPDPGQPAPYLGRPQPQSLQRVSGCVAETHRCRLALNSFTRTVNSYIPGSVLTHGVQPSIIRRAFRTTRKLTDRRFSIHTSTRPSLPLANCHLPGYERNRRDQRSPRHH